MTFACTLVIPTYREVSTIRSCLDSVLAAAMPDGFVWKQWLVVDDSDDGTADVARAWALEHPEVNLQVQVSPERRGKSQALNLCHFAVTKPRNPDSVVVCCDGDGELEAASLQELLSPLSEDPTLAIVWGSRLPAPYGWRQWASAFQMYATEEVARLRGEHAYRAQGSLFAYRAEYFADFSWRSNTAADDVQIADFAYDRGLHVRSAWGAVERVRAAHTLRDFYSQTTRPPHSTGRRRRGSETDVSPRHLVWALTRSVWRRPREGLAYAAERLVIELIRRRRVTDFSDRWTIANSTKQGGP